jgi:hypothetical protein
VCVKLRGYLLAFIHRIAEKVHSRKLKGEFAGRGTTSNG